MNYPRLSSAIDQYISSILPAKSWWYEQGQRSQLKYWGLQLGHMRINQITPEMVKSPGRSPSTKKQICYCLEMCIGSIWF